MSKLEFIAHKDYYALFYVSRFIWKTTNIQVKWKSFDNLHLNIFHFAKRFEKSKGWAKSTNLIIEHLADKCYHRFMIVNKILMNRYDD